MSRLVIHEAEPIIAVADALDAVIAVHQIARERSDLRVFHCVDSSELCEYIVPTSLCGTGVRKYPTSLDFALIYLFRHGPSPVYLLPIYLAEFRGVLRGWQERLVDVEARLRTLEFQDLPVDSASDKALIDYLGSSFHRIAAVLGHGRRGAFDTYKRLLDEDRLQILDSSKIPTFPSPGSLDDERIQFWYSQLCAVQPQVDRFISNMVDAHALATVEHLNTFAEDGDVIILVSHSRKMYRCLFLARAEDQHVFMKHGISLLQPPEIAMVRFHNIEPSDGTRLTTDDETNLSALAEQRDKYASIRDTVFELEEQLRSSKAAKGKMQRRVAEPLARVRERITKSLREYRSLVQQWANLALVDRELTAPSSGLLGDLTSRLHKIIQERDVDELRRCLKERKRELLKDCEGLRRVISTCFPGLPATPEAEFTLATIGRQRTRFQFSPVSGPRYTYRYEFVSKKLKERVDRLHAFGDDIDQRTSELTRLVAHYFGAGEVDAEACLVVSALCSLSLKWLPAYDAASRGLELLWKVPDGPRIDSPRPETEIKRIVTLELMVAYSTTLRRWAIQRFAHRPLVDRWLNMAFAVSCKCRVLRKNWLLRPSVATKGRGNEDPRCLREIGVIMLLAEELGLELNEENGESDRTIAQGDTITERSSHVFELAMDVCKDETLRLFCLNNLIYSKTQWMDESGLRQCMELVSELETSEIADEPQIFDTMAWYHHVAAQSGISPEKNHKRAREFLKMARKSVEKDPKGYDSFVIEKHAKFILA